MSEITIISNYHRRPLIYGYELTEEERQEFDYYTPEALLDCEFARYKGQLYDITDFMRIDSRAPEPMQAWDGYSSDSFFSGVLIKWPEDDDTENVIMGWYYS